MEEYHTTFMESVALEKMSMSYVLELTSQSQVVMNHLGFFIWQSFLTFFSLETVYYFSRLCPSSK